MVKSPAQACICNSPDWRLNLKEDALNMVSRPLAALLLSVLLVLGGCSMFRNYDLELSATNEQLSAGNVDAALGLLQQQNPQEDKDLLYYFEKGELLRAKGDLVGSQLVWDGPTGWCSPGRTR